MNSSDNLFLYQRILEYYHRTEEYGPLLRVNEKPGSLNKSWTRPEYFISPFPTATEEQLRLTEEAMGFPYPPVLRGLYQYVGNGGFGPGLGLIGTLPLDSEVGEDREEKESMLAGYIFPFSHKGVTLIDLQQYEALHGQLKDLDTSTVWPKDLIFLCDWGCACFSFLHAKTGKVYYCTEGYLSSEADSLQEWIERWLQEANAQLRVVDSYLLDSYPIE